MDAKDKVIADLKKKNADLEAQLNSKPSVVGYLDVWNKDSASFRREYTTEWCLETAEMAKQNDGIQGMRYQLQVADRQTPGTIASLQVYGSHCVRYEDDNAEKEKLNISYRNEYYSRNVNGSQIWMPRKQEEKVAVNQ